MTDPPVNLPAGLYERLVTEALDLSLAGMDPALVVREGLDPADADVALVRYLAATIGRALRSLPGEPLERLAAQVRLCNEILAQVARALPQAVHPRGDQVATSNDRLLALLEPPLPPSAPRRPSRPEIPLSVAALLVNGTDQPRIGAEVAKELESADSVDLLSAFIKWEGLRIMQRPLRSLCERGGRLRVITTTYMGATDRRALDALVALGAEVKVSYETRTTRLHAKAWLFHRRSGFTTAYVGSSNLSRSAMVDGLEWNVRLANAEQPYLLDVCAGTFDNYWSDPSFESYEPQRDGARFDRAVAAEHGGGVDLPIEISALEVRPWPYQSEILDRLEAERVLHDRWRNLVVAATGTGKTVIAALDYQRLRAAGKVDRLLFVAHREEILRQSLSVFRHVLRDGAFGESFVAGRRPDEWRHVFASVQSLSQLDLAALAPDRFDMVIVDEFHHAEAPTYARLLDHLQPKVLLGLTATPERTDGRDVLDWFGGRIAAELRLWEALDRGLLCPFQYFGIHDDVDLSAVAWKRGSGYDPVALSNVYTGHDARAAKIAQAVIDKVGDPARMRALGFCVSIGHAEFMAARFNGYGIAATAVSANSSRDQRLNALRDLREGSIKAIFAVDLFNEGVDVPEIDTVLFLRPTESPTVFLQQLGRGLRLADNKACLTVLDFIGNQNAAFRFDLRYRALTGVSRRGLEREVEAGFPYLPSGCHLELDAVAARIVLDNVRRALHLRWRDLVSELASLGDVGLATFLHETGLEPEDLYRSHKGGWAQLRREAGWELRPPGPDDGPLAAAVGRLLHVDDRERLRAYRLALTAPDGLHDGMHDGGRGGRLLAMLHFILWGPSQPLDDAAGDLQRLREDGPRRAEVLEVLDVAAERLGRVTVAADPAGLRPLQVHAHYRLAEALAAFGMSNPSSMRQGVIYFEGEQADAFFVTLRKTERHYSPTTMYQDYAISPRLFHWESQSTTTGRSATGQRYANHMRQATTVHLFVRESKQPDGLLGRPPYLYAGPMRYVSHEGERPMRIVWRLEHDLPPELFVLAKVAAG
jgi:superfamily II DNA or RNA helicase/HKD family nuclease